MAAAVAQAAVKPLMHLAHRLLRLPLPQPDAAPAAAARTSRMKQGTDVRRCALQLLRQAHLHAAAVALKPAAALMAQRRQQRRRRRAPAARRLLRRLHLQHKPHESGSLRL